MEFLIAFILQKLTKDTKRFYGIGPSMIWLPGLCFLCELRGLLWSFLQHFLTEAHEGHEDVCEVFLKALKAAKSRDLISESASGISFWIFDAAEAEVVRSRERVALAAGSDHVAGAVLVGAEKGSAAMHAF